MYRLCQIFALEGGSTAIVRSGFTEYVMTQVFLDRLDTGVDTGMDTPGQVIVDRYVYNINTYTNMSFSLFMKYYSM